MWFFSSPSKPAAVASGGGCHCAETGGCKCGSKTGGCQCGSSSASCQIAKKPDDKPRPCCVCLDQKSVRDECMLLNGSDSPKCQDLVAQYKQCMKGFGFEI